MSACTRATRTRSAGFGWLARVRRAWTSQAASAAPRRVDPELDGRHQVSRLIDTSADPVAHQLHCRLSYIRQCNPWVER
jgi:hypothetical protein